MLRRQIHPGSSQLWHLLLTLLIWEGPSGSPQNEPPNQAIPSSPPFLHPWLQLWSINLLQCHRATPTIPTENHFGSIPLPNLLLGDDTQQSPTWHRSSSSGWLVGVWLLLRVPGEWMISKICIFPPGLITSGFVNGKITSSLALAGGESSRLIQYLRKLHCRAQEAGGRNRLPVSVSAAGDNLCRHRLASVELTRKTSPLPWELGKDGIFSLLPWFGLRGALVQPFVQVLGCGLGPAAPWGGMGSFHGDPAAFPALPRLLELKWDLLSPDPAPARFWVLEVSPQVGSSGRGIHGSRSIPLC